MTLYFGHPLATWKWLAVTIEKSNPCVGSSDFIGWHYSFFKYWKAVAVVVNNALLSQWLPPLQHVDLPDNIEKCLIMHWHHAGTSICILFLLTLFLTIMVLDMLIETIKNWQQNEPL